MTKDADDPIIAALSKERPPEVTASIRRINKQDLLPPQRKTYEALAKKHHAENLAIYAIPDPGNAVSLVEPILDAKKVFIVDEGGVHWTAADAKRNWATLAELEKNCPPLENPELQAIAHGMAATKQIKPPVLLTSPTPDFPGGAYVTRDGVNVIILDPKMSRADSLGTLAHEIGHLANGHQSLRQVVKSHNDPSIQQAQEYEADKETRTFGYEKKQIAFLTRQICEGNELQAEKLKDMVSSGTHPTSGSRIHRLQEGLPVADVMEPSCPIDTPKHKSLGKVAQTNER